MPQRLRTAAETTLNPVVTALFLVAWLLVWPIYLAYRAHQAPH